MDGIWHQVVGWGSRLGVSDILVVMKPREVIRSRGRAVQRSNVSVVDRGSEAGAGVTGDRGEPGAVRVRSTLVSIFRQEELNKNVEYGSKAWEMFARGLGTLLEVVVLGLGVGSGLCIDDKRKGAFVWD